MVANYTKKPVTVQAIQWTGNNINEILEFAGNCAMFKVGTIDEGIDLKIVTLEGTHIASLGDYIIKGVNGEFYPCKPDIFEKTYNEATVVQNIAIDEQIENNFNSHKANQDKLIKYDLIRKYVKDLAYCIKNNVPDGREKSLAMTKLEECCMWANAGIARSKED